MDEIIRTLPNYLTKETITVVGAIATAWIGWKVAAKSFGIVSGLATKFSFFGLTAATMFICGLGATGFGFAEVSLNNENSPQVVKKGFSNDELRKLTCGEDPELMKVVLEYVKFRDSEEVGGIKTEAILDLIATMNAENKEAILTFLKATNEASDYTPVDYNTTHKYEMNPPEADVVKANKPSISYSTSMMSIFAGIAVTVTSIILFIVNPDHYK